MLYPSTPRGQAPHCSFDGGLFLREHTGPGVSLAWARDLWVLTWSLRGQIWRVGGSTLPSCHPLKAKLQILPVTTGVKVGEGSVSLRTCGTPSCRQLSSTPISPLPELGLLSCPPTLGPPGCPPPPEERTALTWVLLRWCSWRRPSAGKPQHGRGSLRSERPSSSITQGQSGCQSSVQTPTPGPSP